MRRYSIALNVLLISGLLVWLGFGWLTASVDRSKCPRNAAELKGIVNAIEQYREDHGNYPVAMNVAELQVAGRPAILVPLPTAMDNHQAINADAFEDAGAGWVMLQEGFTAQALAARLEAFLSAPIALINAAEAARKSASLRATEQLAQLVQG